VGWVEGRRGCGDDRPIDDVRGASLGEDPTDVVCGVLIQFGDVTPAEQTTKLSLAGRAADLGDHGGKSLPGGGRPPAQRP
jgi:hypothetical protein